MTSRMLVLSFAVATLGLFFGMGCAGQKQKNDTTPAQSAANGGGAACDQFARQLCESLGNDTEPCQSLHDVSEWLPAKACDAALADMKNAVAKIKELRKDCETLTEQLCSDLGKDSDSCAEVSHDMPRVPAGHCRTLLAHYPELLAQMQERKARDKPISPEQWAALVQGTAPAFGPSTAKVTIVEFSDFQCPYCAQASEAVKQIRAKYADKVHFVFRQFPLSFHEHAQLAAEAALAAHAQGKFWELHDVLFAHQSGLDRESIERYATDLGLDMKAFKKSLDDKAVDPQIDADVELGKAAHVDGTPTMFLNGKRVDNPTELDAIAPLIDAALSGS